MPKPSDVNTYYAEHLHLDKNRSPVADYELAIQRMLMRELIELCVNRFEWTGLPDGVDKRYLEMTLFRNALSVFYYDNNYGQYHSLPATRGGVSDMNDNPLTFTIIQTQYVHKTLMNSWDLSEAECVPIWANYTRLPDHDVVSIYARRLAKIDRTIEINTDNARQPRVLVYDESAKLSHENFNRQIDQGMPAIRTRTGALPQNTNVLDMGVDAMMFEKLSIMRARIWNECMGLLGIENANQDKKERLVAAEVGANDEQTSLIKRINLNARQLACEQINKKWGLDIWVDYNSEAITASGDEDSEQEIEVETGEIDNG